MTPFFASFLFAALFSSPVEETMEPVYVTATVMEKPLASATASVTVIDRASIDLLGPSSLTELLCMLPGVNVTGGGTRGSFSTAEIRGGDPNFSLVLLNGVPLNDATYQVGDAFDLSGISLSSVQRIEIVRGPLSSFFGSTGLAGAINIITLADKKSDQTTLLEAEAGNGNRTAASASFTNSGERAAFSLSASYEEESERVAAESFGLFDVTGNLDMALSERANLKLSGRFADWDSEDYPDASGGSVFGDGALRDSSHRETVLGLSLGFGNKNRHHELSLGWYRHELDRTSPAISYLVPASDEQTDWRRSRLGWRSLLHRSEHFLFSAGADLDREEGKNNSLLYLVFDPSQPPFPVPGTYEKTRTNYGAYAEFVYQRERLVVELAGRLDEPDGVATEFSPRLGFSASSPKGGTRFHGTFGRAFKLPSFFATASPTELGGNPDLKAETAVSADLGIEHSRGAVKMSMTLFHNRFEQLVDFDFETFRHINRAEVEAKGVESSLSFAARNGISGMLSVTWQDVKDPNSEMALRHRPEWRAGGYLAWAPNTTWNLTVDLSSVSESADQQIPVIDRFTVSGHSLFGLTTSYRFLPDWRARLRVENLTDRDYETLIGFPGPDRGFRFGLRYAPSR